MDDDNSDEAWLLITVSTVGGPSSLRVHVWRKLRSLGALYVQQSACLLPDRPELARATLRLVDRVRHDGGSGRVLHVRLTERTERDQVISEFQDARNQEYAEFLDRIPAFFAEIKAESARRRTTYAEVEENEADLVRFREWMAKIAARDYFAAPGGQKARAELERAEREFAGFETAALNAQEPAMSQKAVDPEALS